eukprot:COSAG01_NODE_6774_length_3504_cov_27.969457_1_plen_47_part_10
MDGASICIPSSAMLPHPPVTASTNSLANRGVSQSRSSRQIVSRSSDS